MSSSEIKRKPSKGEAYMYTNLFWLAIGVFVFIPILNNLFLQLIILSTTGNIAYGSLPEAVATVRDILGAVSSFVGLGVFSVCLINFKNKAFGVIVAAFSSHFVNFCASMLAYSMFADDALNAFFLLGLDMVFNMAVYALIYLVTMLTARKKDSFLNVPPYSIRILDVKHPLSLSFLLTSVIYGTISVLAVLYTMIGDFLDPSLGPPVSRADILYWVMEYLTPVISSVIGYFLMLFVGAYSEKCKRRFN